MTMFCCHDQHYASSASICLHKAPIYLINFLPGYLWEGIHWAVLRIPRDFHMYMDYSALLFSPSFCTWSCRLIAWTMASMATGLDVLPWSHDLCISWYVSKCGSLWLAMISWFEVGREMWPCVFCLITVTCAWTWCCNRAYEIALSVRVIFSSEKLFV